VCRLEIWGHHTYFVPFPGIPTFLFQSDPFRKPPNRQSDRRVHYTRHETERPAGKRVLTFPLDSRFQANDERRNGFFVANLARASACRLGPCPNTHGGPPRGWGRATPLTPRNKPPPSEGGDSEGGPAGPHGGHYWLCHWSSKRKRSWALTWPSELRSALGSWNS